jgi:hypothetical protein
MKECFERAKEKAAALGFKPTERTIVVSIPRQLLGLFRHGRLEKSYVISTSLRPPSNVRNSLGTPDGLHEIAERIGAGAPPGIVFKSRISTGKHFSEMEESERATNLVTTRILWLRGLEAGKNAGGEVDSYDRYIYIHGTNHEGRLGTPASGGCVLMNNVEMIELYDAVRAGDHVWIENV